MPYNQITNITLNVTLWDRICKSGDLTLHTAEDNAPDLKLKFLKSPKHIEKTIYNLIKMNRQNHNIRV